MESADRPTTPAPLTESAPDALCRRNLIAAALLFCGALLALIALQLGMHSVSAHAPGPFSVSRTPTFIWQANAFLHGRWDLQVSPKATDIVVLHGGKTYTIFPPFPALLLLPFVAIFGLTTSDVLFTSVCSALQLSFLFLLFEQVRANGLTRRPWRENALIALIFYFGSITLWLSLGGEMWFTAQIVAVTMTLLSLLLAFRRHYGWSAVALACAFFSRGTLLVAFPLLFYLAWEDVGRDHLIERFAVSLWRRRPDWRAVPWRRLAAPAAVAVAMVALYMVHNALLFGSPFESGYGIIIQQRYPLVKHGVFSLYYFPRDLFANFFAFPQVIIPNPYNLRPTIDMINGGEGSSVFFTTPLFLFLFWRNRGFSRLRAALWVTLGLMTAQILFFHWTGWVTFGARYLFEAYPYAFLLLVLNEVRVDWRFLALGALGILINLAGAYEFWTEMLITI